MGTMADRNSSIKHFVSDLIEKQGFNLFEKWFEHLQKLTPDQKVSDFEVRDKMLEEIIVLISVGNSLILGKKDKLLVEEILNRFISGTRLLNPDKNI